MGSAFIYFLLNLYPFKGVNSSSLSNCFQFIGIPTQLTTLKWWTPSLGYQVAAAILEALHFSARGVTTVPSSNPGYITSDHDRESHRAQHNWPTIVRVWLYCKYEFELVLT
jgi:hypothetical protein